MGFRYAGLLRELNAAPDRSVSRSHHMCRSGGSETQDCPRADDEEPQKLARKNVEKHRVMMWCNSHCLDFEAVMVSRRVKSGGDMTCGEWPNIFEVNI